jgi:Arc/MetJ family transcription regulator
MCYLYTLPEAQAMRTNIEIDDELMRKAMEATGAPTKRAAVEEALQLVVKIKAQSSIRELWGLGWCGPDDECSAAADTPDSK